MRTAVLASGTGSLLRSMLEGGVPVEVVVVDRPCAATEVAAEHGITAELLERDRFDRDFDRLAYTERLVDLLHRHDVELVVMAGFGTILEKPVFDAYEGRILNTHPSLLPAFPGWHAVSDALEAGVRVTGCTVHVATLEVDSGPIVAQEAVPVEADDTVESLHERIKTAERRLYTETVRSVQARGHV